MDSLCQAALNLSCADLWVVIIELIRLIDMDRETLTCLCRATGR